jgi:GxxExxY protein
MNHRGAEPQRKLIPEYINQTSGAVVGAAYAVHSKLGPGLLESVYEKCLAHALRRRGLTVERQKLLPIEFAIIREGILRIAF